MDMVDGVWPTMITAFTDEDALDEAAMEALVEWYIERGVAGLFAVCQSSEMFTLSLEERLRLARMVVRHAAGRVGVIASVVLPCVLPDRAGGRAHRDEIVESVAAIDVEHTHDDAHWVIRVEIAVPANGVL